MENKDHLSELCGNCKCSRGSHLAAMQKPGRYPDHYCPGREGDNNWKIGPGTVFKPTGEYQTSEEWVEAVDKWGGLEKGV